jgi:hypothetical protein
MTGGMGRWEWREARMHCSGCGQALVAGQGFCPRCGRASGLGMPMASVPAPGIGSAPANWLALAQIERQVNALAVGWFVYSGVAAFFGLMGMAFVHASFGRHFGGSWPFSGRFGHPMMGLFWMKFAWMALALRIGLGVAAGIGLMQKTTWGRVVAIVAAFLAVLHFPFGTAIAIWTLVVLLKAPNAAGYEVLAR